MGIQGSKERCLEILAYRYYLKNKNRSSEENWKLACVLLEKLKTRQVREFYRKQRGNICIGIVVLIFIFNLFLFIH